MDNLATAYGVLLNRRELRGTLVGEPGAPPDPNLVIRNCYHLGKLIHLLPRIVTGMVVPLAKHRQARSTNDGSAYLSTSGMRLSNPTGTVPC